MSGVSTSTRILKFISAKFNERLTNLIL